MKATVANVNAAIKMHGLEIVRSSEGYYYFADLAGTFTDHAMRVGSLYVFRLSDMTRDDVVEHVTDCLATFYNKG